ncbi:hypothetical protein M0813_18427 [Anaeramoeba flamelloides]|uniref:RRM domain-containing protein n=1 Tax=Anaeramoeba flamelloides TaxID=1746091 RepID=A0ABQ8YT76_9EUKA|nr:hypothetical protein M0813_18427 [Anaeramoeba flamelloides]
MNNLSFRLIIENLILPTDQEIENFFSQYGVIDQIAFFVPPRNYFFVTYKSYEGCKRTIQGLGNKIIGRRKVIVTSDFNDTNYQILLQKGSLKAFNYDAYSKEFVPVKEFTVRKQTNNELQQQSVSVNRTIEKYPNHLQYQEFGKKELRTDLALPKKVPINPQKILPPEDVPLSNLNGNRPTNTITTSSTSSPPLSSQTVLLPSPKSIHFEEQINERKRTYPVEGNHLEHQNTAYSQLNYENKIKRTNQDFLGGFPKQKMPSNRQSQKGIKDLSEFERGFLEGFLACLRQTSIIRKEFKLSQTLFEYEKTQKDLKDRDPFVEQTFKKSILNNQQRGAESLSSQLSLQPKLQPRLNPQVSSQPQPLIQSHPQSKEQTETETLKQQQIQNLILQGQKKHSKGVNEPNEIQARSKIERNKNNLVSPKLLNINPPKVREMFNEK